ncbi:MAG TPA: sigma-70 family RNA polymerase sigma factor [Actinocrinis sp.]
MSVQDPVSAAEGGFPPVDPSFEAFHRDHQDIWVRYAHACTGSREAAEQIADTVASDLEAEWRHGCPREQAAGISWRMLKAAVKRWIDTHRTRPAFVETAAFEYVLKRTRDRFASLEDSIGLYSAIHRLPKRQFEIIVLHYALGYPFSRITRLLGVSENTARSNLRHAKAHLEKELVGLRLLKIEA